ncbi:MAG: division/cell wall cluster transcriptional repressor MraZ [Chloroflexi bacterium]|nr:division/cell wall cluster transcriptional repressor MraZ [Chloroflexota bacterium]
MLRLSAYMGIVERMFTGEHAHSIDDKGRLTIPARFRAALAEGCYISRGFGHINHLLIYAKADFEAVAAKADKFSLTDPKSLDLWLWFYGQALEDVPDGQGRIMVPQFLREHAGLNGEVRIVGIGRYIAVWSGAAWAEKQKDLNDPAKTAERFASLDLSTG